jgi:calcium-dependent protein kinase
MIDECERERASSAVKADSRRQLYPESSASDERRAEPSPKPGDKVLKKGKVQSLPRKREKAPKYTIVNGIKVASVLSWMPEENIGVGIIDEFFEIGTELGSGVSSQVFVAWDPMRKTNVAIKRMPKAGCAARAFSNEATFLSNLSGKKGVIQLINAAMDRENYYLVTEWAQNGDLLSQVMDSPRKRLSERRTKLIIRSLIETLIDLHSMGIVHRDLKPENVVFVNKQPNTPKLIDFADAVLLKSVEEEYNDLCGTVFYLAPERFRTHTGYELIKSEMWSVGVFVFEMVFGKRAFYGKSDEAVLEKIANVTYHMPRSIPSTPECRHFIRRLLVFDPRKRMSAKKSLKHPWLAESPLAGATLLTPKTSFSKVTL